VASSQRKAASSNSFLLDKSMALLGARPMVSRRRTMAPTRPSGRVMLAYVVFLLGT
jgi:hypothetical protein